MSSEITENEAIQIVCNYYDIDKIPDNAKVAKTKDENNNKVWRLAFNVPVSSDGKLTDYIGYIVYVDVITGEVKPLGIL